MKYIAAIALALPLAGCAGLDAWVQDEGNQERVESVARTGGAAVSGLLGLPPGIGEGVGAMVATGLLAVFGAKKPKK